MSPEVPEPRLSQQERQALDKGVSEFNAARFFECHDTLEDLWSGVRGPSRDFFQGLIQVAVAFHHLTNGNRAGAESLLERALGRFARYPESYYGFELGLHRRELTRWLTRIRSGEAAPDSLDNLPRWRFADRRRSARDPPTEP